VELVAMCEPAGSMEDAEAGSMEDFAERVIGGNLGRDLVPMRVGSGSAKRWVVRDATTACDFEDIVLACMARELLTFPYSHNIPYVIAAAMDPKGKSSTSTFDIWGGEPGDAIKIRKAQAKSPKEANIAVEVGGGGDHSCLDAPGY
jgi:hypothetical protein